MSVWVKKEPWIEITRAVTASRGRVVAAIAYISSNAHLLLPLKPGDILVCDASPEAVSRGSTNPAALRTLLNAGVGVWNVPGLHAKVVVLPKRAFVGSANASQHSAKDLFEAVIDTTASADVTALRRFVLDLRVSPIDSAALDALQPLFPKHTGRLPHAHDPAVLPDHLARLAIVSYHSTDDDLPGVTKAIERGGNTAHDLSRRRGTGYRLDAMQLLEADLAKVRIGDWVVAVVDKKALSPGLVVHVERYGRARAVWYARPKARIAKLSRTATAAANIQIKREVTVITGTRASDVLNLFH